MSDVAFNDSSDEPRPPADPSGTRDAQLATAHRTFRILGYATLIAVLVSIAVNWWFVRGMGEALPSAPTSTAASIPEPGQPALDSPAIELLPDRILQYETITHQAIPGYGDSGAEAVYKTLNMNTEARIEIIVYARSEGFSSAAAAESRQSELMADYTLQQSQAQLGSQIVSKGFTPDKGAYAISWTDGQYVTFVKSSYAEWIPAVEKDLIVEPGEKIADAVEVYQRTGRQGVSK